MALNTSQYKHEMVFTTVRPTCLIRLKMCSDGSLLVMTFFISVAVDEMNENCKRNARLYLNIQLHLNTHYVNND